MTHFPIFKETLDHLDDEHPILYTTAEKYLSLSLKKKKKDEQHHKRNRATN